MLKCKNELVEGRYRVVIANNFHSKILKSTHNGKVESSHPVIPKGWHIVGYYQ